MMCVCVCVCVCTYSNMCGCSYYVCVCTYHVGVYLGMYVCVNKSNSLVKFASPAVDNHPANQHPVSPHSNTRSQWEYSNLGTEASHAGCSPPFSFLFLFLILPLALLRLRQKEEGEDEEDEKAEVLHVTSCIQSFHCFCTLYSILSNYSTRHEGEEKDKEREKERGNERGNEKMGMQMN